MSAAPRNCVAAQSDVARAAFEARAEGDKVADGCARDLRSKDQDHVGFLLDRGFQRDECGGDRRIEGALARGEPADGVCFCPGRHAHELLRLAAQSYVL